MFRIVRFPKKLGSFSDSLKNHFHWDHFQYFRPLVLLIAISWTRRNISALYRHLDSRNQPHRSRFNNFLDVGRIGGGGTDKHLRHYLIEATFWAGRVPGYRPTYERMLHKRGPKIARVVVARMMLRSIHKMLQNQVRFSGLRVA